MADWRKFYGIPVYTADKLGKKPIKAKIVDVSPEEIIDKQTKQPESRLHLTLENHSLQVRLNQTNCKRLAVAFGDDTDDWVGKTIELRIGQTKFNGKMTDCIETIPSKK